MPGLRNKQGCHFSVWCDQWKIVLLCIYHKFLVNRMILFKKQQQQQKNVFFWQLTWSENRHQDSGFWVEWERKKKKADEL